MSEDATEIDRRHMLIGTVRFVSAGGDYGFIARDDKHPKVFVHITAVEAAGLQALEKGQRWSFDITETDEGRRMASILVAAR